MSVRHRAIAGSPERSASEAAAAIVEMVSETLAAAPALNADVVGHELEAATAPIRMLVAGKHLGATPLVLLAEPLRLEVTIVSGEKAIGLEEKLGKVAGAATASDWMLHLPSPQPIDQWVSDAVDGLGHVTVAPPRVARTAASATAVRAADLDLDALRRAVGGGR